MSKNKERRICSTNEDGVFTVHRVKFFNYKPCAIHCLAYDEDSERLAVVRSDGSIEIWRMKHSFNQERIIPGRQNGTCSLDSVAWVKGRLFSTGFEGDITEYDLKRNSTKYSVLYGNASWCLAPNHAGTILATGNEDGYVRLFDLTTEKVTYDRIFNPQEQRIVSLAWHNSDEIIVTGSIDNIKIWNVATGSAVQRITLQRAFKKKETTVWCIAILSDRTIVSGDSTGRTIFWDGHLGTMLKGYTSHRMDILSLCVTKDETSVFTAGVDPIIVQFKLTVTDRLESSKSWVRSRHITFGHTNDIRALTIAGNFLVSGGLDTNLVTNPVEVSPGQSKFRNQMEKYKRLYSAFPQRSLVHYARKSRRLLFQYSYHLEVWQLGSATTNSTAKDGTSLQISESPINLLDIQTKGNEQIVCSSISECGTWIAYSDVDKVKVFHCSLNPPSLQKVSYLPPQLCPAHCLAFAPDSSKLFIGGSSCSVQILTLDTVQPSLLHTFQAMDNSILLVGVDCTSKFVAAADVSGNICVYNSVDFKIHCRLPRYLSQPTAMAFSPHSSELFVTYADQMLYEFDIVMKSYTDWSRKLHQCKIHPVWLRRRSTIIHVSYSATNPNLVFLHDVNMFCAIDKSKPLPKAHQQLFKKELLEGTGQEFGAHHHSFITSQRFKPLLFMDCLDEDGGLIVVEYPLQRLVENLPSTLKQKKFGT